MLLSAGHHLPELSAQRNDPGAGEGAPASLSFILVSWQKGVRECAAGCDGSEKRGKRGGVRKRVAFL